MPKRGEKILRPVFPNAGIAAAYRRKLDALVAEMAASYAYFLKAQYRQTPPALAQDASPAEELRRELRKLGRRWEERFDDAAAKLARWFATSAARRSEDALKKILRDAGISVRFQMTPAMRDILAATVTANVGLVKSIPSQYHSQVENLVMRSVTEGRNLGFLTDELEKRYGITRRRAAFIASDQNNKTTAMLSRARQLSVGLEEAIWLHSGGGRHPRPTHIRNSGKKFSLRDGWPDPALKGKRIWPGTEPNCRCVSKPVVSGFS